MMGPLDVMESLSPERFEQEFDEVKRHLAPLVEGQTDDKTYRSALRAFNHFSFEAAHRAGEQADLIAAYAARVARGEG